MNAKDLAATLNGREYGDEVTREVEFAARTAGLVVVFGASDDLMEFRGMIHDEIGAYQGVIAHLNRDGLMVNKCEDEHCPYFEKAKESATTITAHWDSGGYSWTYETAIPHETFEILEEGGKYCRGVVFALADVPA